MLDEVGSLTKTIIGTVFFIGAAWIAWQGRTYDGMQPSLTVPVMCMMVALTFSLTGYALILRSED